MNVYKIAIRHANISTIFLSGNVNGFDDYSIKYFKCCGKNFTGAEQDIDGYLKKSNSRATNVIKKGFQINETLYYPAPPSRLERETL